MARPLTPETLVYGFTTADDPQIAPDGSAILYTRSKADKETQKMQGQLWLCDVDGGNQRQITWTGNRNSMGRWSPDGSQIAFVSDRVEKAGLFVLPFNGGAEAREVTRHKAGLGDIAWSPDGMKLAAQYATHNGFSLQLAIIDVESGQQTLVGREMGVIGAWSWSPDGSRIIIAGDESQTFQLDFFVYDIASGELTRLTGDLECLPTAVFPGEGGGGQPVWLDDRQVLFHAVRAGGSGLWVIDSEQGSVEPVAWWQAQHGGFSVDRDRRYIVQSRTSMEDHGELVVYDNRTNEQHMITELSKPVLEASPPALWEKFDIERNGYTIESWLLKPPDFDESRTYPVILDIHGGPNGFYGYALSPQHQSLATAGFLVVYSNPRGSTSYGREFTQQVTEDWGGEDYLDLMAVVDEVLKRPYADAERTGVTGYSYGGYMTAWIIGQTDRFKAAVCGAPCFDLESMYGTSDISHAFGPLQWGGAPHEAREWYDKHSPSSYAHRATTPTLIIHGEADERCPIGQGEQMFIALKTAGVDVEFARYPDAAHGFRRNGYPEHRVDCFQRTLEWFRRYLG
jgi:dipeptidyl aminopeptidase/acylaminoacyl peptidase